MGRFDLHPTLQMPLLRSAIEVKELIFEGAQVTMVAKEDGANNWTFPTDEAEDETTLDDLRRDTIATSRDGSGSSAGRPSRSAGRSGGAGDCRGRSTQTRVQCKTRGPVTRGNPSPAAR